MFSGAAGKAFDAAWAPCWLMRITPLNGLIIGGVRLAETAAPQSLETMGAMSLHI